MSNLGRCSCVTALVLPVCSSCVLLTPLKCSHHQRKQNLPWPSWGHGALLSTPILCSVNLNPFTTDLELPWQSFPEDTKEAVTPWNYPDLWKCIKSTKKQNILNEMPMEQSLVAATLAMDGLMRIWEEPETPKCKHVGLSIFWLLNVCVILCIS